MYIYIYIYAYVNKLKIKTKQINRPPHLTSVLATLVRPGAQHVVGDL